MLALSCMGAPGALRSLAQTGPRHRAQAL